MVSRTSLSRTRGGNFDPFATLNLLLLRGGASSLFRLQSWQKKCVLGCVISPLCQQAESRNLGHTFFANSVDMLPAVYQIHLPWCLGGLPPIDVTITTFHARNVSLFDDKTFQFPLCSSSNRNENSDRNSCRNYYFQIPSCIK